MTWKHAGVLVGSQALLLATEFLVPSWVQQIPGIDMSVQWGVNIVLFVGATFLALGFYRAVEKASRGKAPAWSDLISEYQSFGNYLLCSISYALVGFLPVVIAGFLTYQAYQAGEPMIVPGALLLVMAAFSGFFLARYQFFIWFLLRGEGFAASFRKSWQVTRGRFRPALALLVWTHVFYVAGLLFLGIGLAVAYPVTSIASVLVLTQLEMGLGGRSKK